jgi:rhodanese-related sulfurtransferase
MDDLRIDAREVHERMQRGDAFLFVDARNPTAYATATEQLPGALRVSLDDVAAAVPRLPRGRPIVAYCT